MREYFRLTIVLWKAPPEVKKQAEEEMKSELELLPQELRDKANQSRGKKEWKIALAAKVKSILANEKRSRSQQELDRLQKGGADAAEMLKALARVNESTSKAVLSDANFRAEWGRFRLSLLLQK